MEITPPEKAGDSPKYQWVFDTLQRDILSGRYRSGEKLPSEAELVKRFGVSRITAGRAVEELRRRDMIERRAGSGTYVRAQARARGLSFGLLIPELGRTEIFEPICHGIAEAPATADHALIWGTVGSQDSLEAKREQAWRLCENYIQREVNGIFFAPLEGGEEANRTNGRIAAALERARIPIVLLDRDYMPYPQRSPHDLVGIDNRRVGYVATTHLLQQGCRRVGYLDFADSASTVAARMAGYREALFMAKAAFDASLVQKLSRDESGDLADVKRMLETVKPDALVCANDRTAGRLMRCLGKLSVRVPEQLRIVGVDDTGYANLLPVPLTTMRQPCREIGIAAMSTMLERLSRPESATRDVRLEARLIVRESCGAASLEALAN